MKNKFFWTFFLFLSFTITLPVSWWGIAKADFFYAFLHDAIGIDQHIQRYAPKNQMNKKDFEKTTKEKRVELFHGIVVAIHNQGRGLQQLSYINPQKQTVALLIEAEIIHLKDVANLLQKLKPVAVGLILLWFLVVIVICKKRIKMPSAKQFGLSTLALLLISAAILALGPEKVFNQLHIWIFPDNHQWFFYYEESLMSILMKAPDLFGYITVIWVLVSVLLTVILIKVVGVLALFRN